MAGKFDPATRYETWVFEKLKKNGREVSQRLKYNWVEYDGIPERHLEPVSNVQFTFSPNPGASIDLALPEEDFGQGVGFEFVEGRALSHNGTPLHRFD